MTQKDSWRTCLLFSLIFFYYRGRFLLFPHPGLWSYGVGELQPGEAQGGGGQLQEGPRART